MADLKGKRILYVITSSKWGGAQRYVYDLATAAQAAGATPAVVVGGDGPFVKRLREARIPVFSLSGLERDLSPAHDTASFFTLYRILRDFNPAVAHLNSSKAGGLAALAARLAGVPRIIFTAHGWPFEERRSSVWRALAYLGSYATARLSHEVIVISRKDERIGARMPWIAPKIRLIYNGIGPLSLGDGAIIRDAFPRGARIIGTIGELNRNKNHIALIEEARKDPSLYVAIVGEGELRPYLEERIRAYGLTERVKLFGFLPASEVLRGFDVFALPSLKEGLPYALIEAKAAALPLAANQVGGVPDILAADPSVFALPRMIAATFACY